MVRFEYGEVMLVVGFEDGQGEGRIRSENGVGCCQRGLGEEKYVYKNREVRGRSERFGGEEFRGFGV